MSRKRWAFAATVLAFLPFVARAGTMDTLAGSNIDAALAAHAKGDDKKAEKKLHDALKSCGKSGCSAQVQVDALMDLGVVQGALGKSSDAKQSFLSALKLNPKADVPKALLTPEVKTVLDSARPAPVAPVVSASAPPSASAALPPPPPVTLVPTKQVEDANWVEGVGLVRNAATDQNAPPASKSLLAPPIAPLPDRGAFTVGVSLASYTPHPDGVARCPTAKVPHLNLGVGWSSHSPGDIIGLGFQFGMGLIGIGSISADPTNPCALGDANGASIVTPLRFVGLFTFDLHPPGILNALSVGPFLGARGQMWILNVGGGGTANGPSSAPTFDLGAEYGAHAHVTLGSIATYSGFLDGSYRLRWSGDSRGDYGRFEGGLSTPGIVIGLYYEKLLKAVGGDLTDADPSAIFSKNVPLDSEIGLYCGFRF